MSFVPVCPACSAAGEKPDRISVGGTLSTLMLPYSFYEDDVRHHHDSNDHTTEFRCSNGHSFVVSRRHPCPGCDYNHDVKDIVRQL